MAKQGREYRGDSHPRVVGSAPEAAHPNGRRAKISSMAIKPFAARRGRPTKFGRPSRAVTLTLPEDVIAALAQLDDDLGRAIVRVSQPLVSGATPHGPAELARYGSRAVIVTRQINALNRMPGVLLVPLSDGRALISLDDTVDIHQFELELRDALAEDVDLNTEERATITAIGDILKTARRTRGVAVHRRAIIVLQFTR